MNKEDAHIVIAMANHNMNVTDVARAIFAHRNTVLYHLDKVKRQSGLDPRRFYDLVELVKMAQEVLENIWYCVPYGKRTEEKDWNCLDMVLDNEQAKQLADYAVKKEVYNWDGVESVVATALMHENKVVINANW